MNLEYLLVKTAQFFAGIDIGGLPDVVTAAVWWVLVIGMGLTFVLLVLAVYAQVRLHQTEHAGFRAIEQQARRAREHALEGEPEEPRNGRWERILELANSSNSSDWRRAILEADIMLGDALAGQGYTGATIADQLRNANPIQMTTLDLAWKAHKVRNDVAHRGEQADLTDRDVRATVDQYRRVFDEFGIV